MSESDYTIVLHDLLILLHDLLQIYCNSYKIQHISAHIIPDSIELIYQHESYYYEKRSSEDMNNINKRCNSSGVYIAANQT